LNRRGVMVVLDRDGVLNRLLWDTSTGQPDSPMRACEVEVFAWVPAVIRELTEAGFGLVVATNQPAWAKGKTTRAELLQAHERVLREAQSEGGVILSSHVCLHRAEDGCDCRKPKPGLILEAFRAHAGYDLERSWMVGDRATDVIAGASLQLKTALLGPSVLADDAVLAARGLKPCYHGTDLRDFAEFLVAGGQDPT
jgi:D-glycero-D-manno-heptose 1,7-bisphosphate phosphatase